MAKNTKTDIKNHGKSISVVVVHPPEIEIINEETKVLLTTT